MLVYDFGPKKIASLLLPFLCTLTIGYQLTKDSDNETAAPAAPHMAATYRTKCSVFWQSNQAS